MFSKYFHRFYRSSLEEIALRLRFPLRLPFTEYPLGELENGYRRHYLHQDIAQTITIGSIWLLPSFLFIITDYFMHSGQGPFQQLLPIRLFQLVLLALALFFMRRIKSPQLYDYLVLVGCFFLLGGVFQANQLHPQIHTHTAGIDYLLLFSIYMLIPNRLCFRILPCLFFSIANIFSHYSQASSLSGPILAIITVSLVLSNALGIWASVRFYSHRRQQYEAQTRAQELRKDLIHNALVDQLTGVANRRHFFQAAEEEFSRFSRYNRTFSLLMLDLDHFKEVNDQFGHPVGDKVLKELSRTILLHKRDSDLFGRLGGEEFALLLPETNLAGATEIAVRLRRSCHTLAVPGHLDIRITISIGVTQVRSEDTSFDDVLSRVDKALYRAKNNGRDRVEVA
jgi:diguanylate cyclase (GGDEF)-like protein